MKALRVRIKCDPQKLAASTLECDVGKVVARGQDWIDLDVTDPEAIAAIRTDQIKPSMGTDGKVLMDAINGQVLK